jgi:hypothetical protein
MRFSFLNVTGKLSLVSNCRNRGAGSKSGVVEREGGRAGNVGLVLWLTARRFSSPMQNIRILLIAERARASLNSSV